MPVRARNGKLEWRFMVNHHEYSGVTDLEDTKRNRDKCARIEAAKRKLVLEGRESELRLLPEPFSSASEKFLEWAKGEYKEHPNSQKRLAGSMVSLVDHFGKKPLLSITDGDIEDYKSWRRSSDIQEITLRHDLHALSGLFQYGAGHNWCSRNPLARGADGRRAVSIPSDAGAVRMRVLSREDEARYFSTCEALLREKLAGKRAKESKGLQDMADLHRLMLLQGCRPEELRALEQEHVDLERGEFAIVRGKSDGARRTLKMRVEARTIFARRQNGGRFVFPGNKPGRHIGVHQRLHDRVVERSGVTCVPYDFRHTFASRAANEDNMPLAILAAILGHGKGNLRSVMKYVHTSQADMAREMARLDAGVVAVPEVKAEAEVVQ